MIYRNSGFTKRDYECTNIVAWMGSNFGMGSPCFHYCLCGVVWG